MTVSTASREVRLYKASSDDRLGISLQAGKLGSVQVKGLVAGGVAEASGLLVGDEVLSICDTPVDSALEAARVLRESIGSINVRVEHRDACAESPGGSYAETEDDNSEHDNSDEPSDEDIVWEWEQYLDWMIERILAREEELKDCQQETADALAQSMLSIVEPTPPSEEDMANPEVMQMYMEEMAVYAQQQQDRLIHLDDEAEENREASAALMLCVARRQELEGLLDHVHLLTEADAERIEEIWQELSRGSEMGDSLAETAAEEPSPAQELDSEPSLPLGKGGALARLRENGKQLRIAQRLQRASSAGSVASPAKLKAVEPDEVGCLIHPM